MAGRKVPGKASFQDDWLQVPEFRYIVRVEKDPHSAYCSLCFKKFDLSNMGRRAVQSHIEGKKHSDKFKSSNTTHGIRMFAANAGGAVRRTIADAASEANPDDPEPLGAAAVTAGEVQAAAGPGTPQGTAPTPGGAGEGTSSGLRGLSQWIQREEVTRAEIIWSLASVMHHLSQSAAGQCASLLPYMLPDSQIASKMQLGRTKIAYIINHGLGPYFNESVFSKAAQSDFIAVYFDESLNKSAQNTQMDFALGFWDHETSKVSVRYFSSSFLGHTTASDLLGAFLQQIKPNLLKKLTNVSMDGPNVNLKFMKDLQAEIKAKSGPDDPTFLFMGSCGLHVVNGAFKTGAKAADWKLVEILRAMYNFFKNVPARRHDYIVYSGSRVFPLKFCAVRWLHNADVAERAIAVIPNLQKYVTGIKQGKKEKDITTASYERIKEALQDKLITAKLAFFAHIANILEPFLTEFQSDKPMAPFLFCSLEGIFTDLMKIFVKKKVLEKNTDVHKVDLTDDSNLLTANELSLKFSFSVEGEFKKSAASPLEKLQFKNDCRSFLRALCSKLLEKSPLAYSLCRGISSLDPGLIGSRQRGSATVSVRFRLALSTIQENHWLSPRQCDKINKEYLELVGKRDVHDACKAFDRKEGRLDEFWMQILTEHKGSEDLRYFVKLCLVLSHGNAFVERGFSINKEVEVENQRNESLVAQRQVFDGVKAAGGIRDVAITQKMINKVKLSRQEYMSALEERRKESSKSDEERLKMKRLTDEIRSLQEKRRRVTAQLDQEKNDIDDQIAMLCQQRGQ